MKKALYFSLLLNAALFAALAFLIYRLGGPQYALHRMRHSEAGLYAHRVQLFEKMQPCPGATVFLGDSQIEQCEWSELLRDSVPVLNRGITGDHTEGVLKRLPEIFRHTPKRIYLEAGVNDLLFGRPAEEVALNYQKIVQEIRRAVPQTELILLSILPVNNDLKRTGIDNADVQAVNRRIRDIAGNFAISYLDLHAYLTNARGDLSEKFTDDGLHLNGLGYAAWKQAMRR